MGTPSKRGGVEARKGWHPGGRRARARHARRHEHELLLELRLVGASSHADYRDRLVGNAALRLVYIMAIASFVRRTRRKTACQDGAGSSQAYYLWHWYVLDLPRSCAILTMQRRRRPRNQDVLTMRRCVVELVADLNLDDADPDAATHALDVGILRPTASLRQNRENYSHRRRSTTQATQ